MSDNVSPEWTDSGQQPRAEPPQEQKRSWYKKKRYIIPLALVALLIVIPTDDPGTETVTTDTAAQAPAEPAPAEAEAPAPEAEAPAPEAEAEAPPPPPPPPPPAAPEYPGAQPDDVVADPGAEIQLSGWTVTATPLERTQGGFMDEVICSTVTYVNRDDERQEYGPLSWEMQTPNGNVQTMTFTGENDLDSGGLVPGGTVTRRVCFDDEGAGPGQYLLLWEPDVFSSNDRGVWINSL